MSAVRVILSFQLASILLLMATFPPYYDSHRSFVAHRHYFVNPTPETLREIEAAKRLDRRDIRIYESIMATLLVVCGVAFIRADKMIKKTTV